MFVNKGWESEVGNLQRNTGKIISVLNETIFSSAETRMDLFLS